MDLKERLAILVKENKDNKEVIKSLEEEIVKIKKDKSDCEFLIKHLENKLRDESLKNNQMAKMQEKYDDYDNNIKELNEEIVNLRVKLNTMKNDYDIKELVFQEKCQSKVKELENDMKLFSYRNDNIRIKEDYIKKVQNENKEMLEKIENFENETKNLDAHHFIKYDIKTDSLKEKFMQMLNSQKQRYLKDLNYIQENSGTLKRIKVLQIQELFKEIEEMSILTSKLFDKLEFQEIIILKLKNKLLLEESMMSAFAEKNDRLNKEINKVNLVYDQAVQHSDMLKTFFKSKSNISLEENRDILKKSCFLPNNRKKSIVNLKVEDIFPKYKENENKIDEDLNDNENASNSSVKKMNKTSIDKFNIQSHSFKNIISEVNKIKNTNIHEKIDNAFIYNYEKLNKTKDFKFKHNDNSLELNKNKNNEENLSKELDADEVDIINKIGKDDKKNYLRKSIYIKTFGKQSSVNLRLDEFNKTFVNKNSSNSRANVKKSTIKRNSSLKSLIENTRKGSILKDFLNSEKNAMFFKKIDVKDIKLEYKTEIKSNNRENNERENINESSSDVRYNLIFNKPKVHSKDLHVNRRKYNSILDSL